MIFPTLILLLIIHYQTLDDISKETYFEEHTQSKTEATQASNQPVVKVSANRMRTVTN